MAGYMNAKHVDWDSGLTTSMGACVTTLIETLASSVGKLPPPRFPTNTKRPSTFFDVVVAKDFALPVQLTVCSTLSLDRSGMIIYNAFRLSIYNLIDRPGIMLMDTELAQLQAFLEERFQGNPTVNDEEALAS
jgi:hypothetical protein